MGFFFLWRAPNRNTRTHELNRFSCLKHTAATSILTLLVRENYFHVHRDEYQSISSKDNNNTKNSNSNNKVNIPRKRENEWIEYWFLHMKNTMGHQPESVTVVSTNRRFIQLSQYTKIEIRTIHKQYIHDIFLQVKIEYYFNKYKRKMLSVELVLVFVLHYEIPTSVLLVLCIVVVTLPKKKYFTGKWIYSMTAHTHAVSIRMSRLNNRTV